MPPGAPDLVFRLDHPLPDRIAVGAGTAVHVAGSCFCREAPIERLELLVDGEAQPLTAASMPRGDVFAALHPRLEMMALRGGDTDPESEDDPELRSYRSGFWGLATLRPGRDRHEIGLRAHLPGGRRLERPLATIADDPLPAPLVIDRPAAASGPLVAIALATYNPPAELLAIQLDSLRRQTHRNWICVISDDGSDPGASAVIERAIAGDRRFVLDRSPRRRGFYHNFERALALCPADARFVALCDQDDRWYEDKLATLLGAIGDAELAFSDQRLVSRDGTELAATYWSLRRPNHEDLTSLLVANSVTGAACLFRRALLDVALPFPPRQFTHFHDHWLALVARSLGRIVFVDRPLYDYVQHGNAVIGHANANWMPGLRQRLSRIGQAPRGRIGRWRAHYFTDVLRLAQFATVIELRGGDRLPSGSRRALTRFRRADRSLVALARLGWRGGRALRGDADTLGAEIGLAFALLWRRLATALAGSRPLPRRRLRLDARPPTSLLPPPGRRDPGHVQVRAVIDKIAPLELAIDDDAPERINLLLPTIDLDHFFGGYIAKLNLARRLSERGARLRIVTTDPVPPLPQRWRERIARYRGLDGVFDHVEVAFGREQAPLTVGRSDRFIATTWWTALIADAAVAALDGAPFLYLIQEYEPLTFPMGSYAALAEDSYRREHRALFSSELLRDFFRDRAIGVYRAGRTAGDRRSLSFQNAITPVEAPTAASLRRPGARRLLFYARPEAHAARNLFELGVVALGEAVAAGAFPGRWEFAGIGSIGPARRLALGQGAEMTVLPRTDQDGYARLLRGADVGLALMMTPHPSLVPIEMASAGMTVVTTRFATKTPAALQAISTNILAPEAAVGPIAAALADAAARSDDRDARIAGSDVAWSRDWDVSFGDAVLDELDRVWA